MHIRMKDDKYVWKNTKGGIMSERVPNINPDLITPPVETFEERVSVPLDEFKDILEEWVVCSDEEMKKILAQYDDCECEEYKDLYQSARKRIRELEAQIKREMR